MPNVIDLFSGVGGMSLGASMAGFNVLASVELDPIIAASHEANFPNTRSLNGDVSLIHAHDLLNGAGIRDGQVDCLVGGPPCQGFSSIGKGRADDPRNHLFVHFFRLVRELKPLIYVAENVPGILQSKYTNIRQEAHELVAEDYESLPPVLIRASDVGAPTMRTRVFFIGYQKHADINLEETLFSPSPTLHPRMVRDALAGLPSKILYDPVDEVDGGWRIVGRPQNGTYAYDLSSVVPKHVGNPVALERYFSELTVSGFLGTRHSTRISDRYAALAPGTTDPISKSSKLRLEGLCPTLRAGTGSDKGSFQAVRPIHPTEPRVITPREAARLQGFPDWYQFHKTKWHSFREIGNSVSPLVSAHIMRIIYRHVF